MFSGYGPVADARRQLKDGRYQIVVICQAADDATFTEFYDGNILLENNLLSCKVNFDKE